jgi:restriction system protein
LKQFPEFIEFQSPKRKGDPLIETADDIINQTPEEILVSAYLNIRKSLAQDLIIKVMQLPPVFFEKLVVELLVKM